MIGGLGLAALIGCAALAWVLAPLVGHRAREAERTADRIGAESELRSRKEMLLAAIRDLEDDRATDKIDESDYAELHATLTAQAVEVIRSLDVIDAAGKPPDGGPVPREWSR